MHKQFSFSFFFQMSNTRVLMILSLAKRNSYLDISANWEQRLADVLSGSNEKKRPDVLVINRWLIILAFTLFFWFIGLHIVAQKWQLLWCMLPFVFWLIFAFFSDVTSWDFFSLGREENDASLGLNYLVGCDWVFMMQKFHIEQLLYHCIIFYKRSCYDTCV